MLYWSSYGILSSYHNLTHFYMILDNKNAPARQEDLE